MFRIILGNFIAEKNTSRTPSRKKIKSEITDIDKISWEE